MNMQNLMAQAQKMQRDITKKQEEINSMEFSGKSELVEVVFYGNKKFKSIKILKNEFSNKEDIEMLEDMIKLAIDDVLKQIDKEVESKMGMYSKMNGLF